MKRTATISIREHRKRVLANDKGFTLIELLVVVVIIGILAAAAIPAFLSQREKAQNSSVQQDVKNTITALESYYIDNGTYPTTTAQAQAGAKVSDKVKLQVYVSSTAGTNGYAIYGIHKDSGVWYMSTSQGGSGAKKSTLAKNAAAPTSTQVATEAGFPTGTAFTAFTLLGVGAS